MVKVKSIGNGGIEGVFNGQTMAGLAQRGKIGISSGYGFARRGNSKYGISAHFSGVYQKRVTGYNNTGRIANRPRRTYYVRERYYRPTNPQTVEQQANRSKFSDAVQGWTLLTIEEKSVYNQRGKRANKIGRNLYISEYMRTH